MREKILYISPDSSTFIQKDITFLSGRYEVVTPSHDWKTKSETPLNFLKQFVFLCRHLGGSRAVFVMFGGYWSFLPALMGKLFRIPVYIIPGGTDCVSFPSLKYGSLRKPVMRTFIRWSFMLCRELLPVDGSLVISDYNFHEKSDYPKQGYKYFFPGITTPYRVIHNGFDPGFFNCDPGGKRKGSFIMVATVTSMTRVRVKGIDLVMYLAEQYPQCSFTLIGVSDNVTSQLGPIPGNVSIHPWLEQPRFRSYLAESQFVLQLSVSEGFPNALCEAMLCHCIPVGSTVGAIPEIIGETGFLVASSDKKYLKGRFDEILSTDDAVLRQMALKARTRIAENYHISKREEAFFKLLN
jgi:glycosyltransferase involved in cell wall biosynthesis